MTLPGAHSRRSFQELGPIVRTHAQVTRPRPTKSMQTLQRISSFASGWFSLSASKLSSTKALHIQAAPKPIILHHGALLTKCMPDNGEHVIESALMLLKFLRSLHHQHQLQRLRLSRQHHLQRHLHSLPQSNLKIHAPERITWR